MISPIFPRVTSRTRLARATHLVSAGGWSTCYLYCHCCLSYHQSTAGICWWQAACLVSSNCPPPPCHPTISFCPRTCGLISPLVLGCLSKKFRKVSHRKYDMDKIFFWWQKRQFYIFRRRLGWLRGGRRGMRRGTFAWENLSGSRRKKKRRTTIHWSNTRLPPTVITITAIFIQVGDCFLSSRTSHPGRLIYLHMYV